MKLLLFVLLAISAVADSAISYDLPEAAQVSLAVFDAEGRQQRTLLSGVRQDAGTHEASWDGLDWSGRPVPPGDYEWRSLSSQGLKSEFLLKIGTPYNEHPWPNNHGGPYRLAVCGDRAFMGGSGEVVANNAVVDLNDGSLLGHGGVRCDTMVGDGNRIAALSPGRLELYEVDANQHPQRTQSFSLNELVTRLEIPAPEQEIGEGLKLEEERAVSIAVPAGVFALSLSLRNGPGAERVRVFANDGEGQLQFLREEEIPPGGGVIEVAAVASVGGKVQVKIEALELDALCRLRAVEVHDPAKRVALAGDLIAVAYPGSGRILWFDTAEIGTAMVPGLRDLVLRADGTALAISGSEIVELGPGQAAVTRVTGLRNPQFLAIDKAKGELFVAEGSGSWQVRRYDSSFRETGVFGRAGGRQQGLYEPTDFLNVVALAADGKGGFLVLENECPPRRLAHFDAAGDLLREWNGGQLFFTLASSSAAEPSRVWMNAHWGWLMETEVDYEARTWRPRASYTVNNVADGLYRCSHLGTSGTVVHRGDARYLVPGDGPRLVLVDEEARQLRALTAFGRAGSPSATLNGWLAEANAKLPKTKAYTSFFWQDANGDGEPQREEVSYSHFSQWQYRWTQDADFNFYFFETSKTHQNIHRLPVLRWDGVRPVYPPLEDAEQIASIPLPPQQKQWHSGDLLITPDNDFYGLVKGRGEGFTADYRHTSHTGVWPTSLSGEIAFCKWSAALNGLEWRVGKLATGGGRFIPGQLDDPVRTLGRHRDMILVANRVVMPLQAWTEDGLFAGSMFDRRADDGLPEKFYKWWRGKDRDGVVRGGPLQYDMMVGGSIVPEANGDLLYFGAGWNDVPVYRVSGWGNFQRQSGRLRLAESATAAAGKGTGLKADYFGQRPEPVVAPSLDIDNAFVDQIDEDDLALEFFGEPPPAPVPADLEGKPALRQVDPLIWFGNPDTFVKKAWPDPELCEGHFSARWTGFLEPVFSEYYVLKAYVGGRPWDRVRVWLAGELIIDGWDRADDAGMHILSSPIPLRAGRALPIKIEYIKGKTGQLHLCWESKSQEVEHIPTRHLYPERAP